MDLKTTPILCIIPKLYDMVVELATPDQPKGKEVQAPETTPNDDQDFIDLFDDLLHEEHEKIADLQAQIADQAEQLHAATHMVHNEFDIGANPIKEVSVDEAEKRLQSSVEMRNAKTPAAQVTVATPDKPRRRRRATDGFLFTQAEYDLAVLRESQRVIYNKLNKGIEPFQSKERMYDRLNQEIGCNKSYTYYCDITNSNKQKRVKRSTFMKAPKDRKYDLEKTYTEFLLQFHTP